MKYIAALAPPNLKTISKILRLQQWVKNIILFVPLIAAHQAMTLPTIITLSIAFFSFCLCASAVYIINDVKDIESDQNHPIKRFRPFASNEITPFTGGFITAGCLSLSLILAHAIHYHFTYWLLAYFSLAMAYTFALKRLAIIDCLALAMLYTIRIAAGASALHIALSYWLLAFSIFIFLSLAFLKRYTELMLFLNEKKMKLDSRDYSTTDRQLIQQFGVTSGYASILVLALYINSTKVIQLYHTPEILWGAIVLMLFWVSWMWLTAHRGKMNDDPIAFVVKDKTSLICFAILIIIFALARM